jgi:hypothetical protein
MPNGPTKSKYTVKPAREKFSFDVEGAVLFFGGFISFQEQLVAAGLDAPSYNNFRGWRTRRTMSADLIARMIRLAKILDVPFVLDDYIIDPIAMTTVLPEPAIKIEPVKTDEGDEADDEALGAVDWEGEADPIKTEPAAPVNPRAMRRGSDV